jgi:SAM-dependent methyltransferase
MAEDATSLYAQYRSWKGWASEEFGELDAETRVYLDREMVLCGVSMPSVGSVLEIGFGNGSFAAWATARGARYRGTEQIPELLDAARRCGVEAHSSEEPIDSFVSPETLDLVVAFDVFEHVEIDDLTALLGTLARGLKPGGLLVARVPSGDSPFSRPIQYGDLTHRTTLGSSAIHQLVEDLPFEVDQIRGPAFPIGGLGPRTAVRRWLVSTLRRLIYPLMTRILMGGASPVLEPNLVFVLKKRGGDPSVRA